MTTRASRAMMRAALDRARHNAERAEMLGDYTGAVIAAGEARRLQRAMIAGAIADQAERDAARSTPYTCPSCGLRAQMTDDAWTHHRLTVPGHLTRYGQHLTAAQARTYRAAAVR